MNKTENVYTRETLLDVLESYARMIKRENSNGNEYAVVVLDDIRASIEFVLSRNGR